MVSFLKVFGQTMLSVCVYGADFKVFRNLGVWFCTAEQYSSERTVKAASSPMHLQVALQMSSVRFSTCLDT